MFNLSVIGIILIDLKKCFCQQTCMYYRIGTYEEILEYHGILGGTEG